MINLRKVVVWTSLIFLFVVLGNTEALASENVNGFKKAVKAGITARNTAIDVSNYDIDVDNVYDYYYDLYYSDPALFSAEWKSYTHIGGYVCTLKIQYKYTASQTSTFISKFNTEVNTIVSGVNSSMTQLEKVLYVHEYFVKNYSYDYDSYLKYAAGNKNALADEHYTAIGVMVNKTGVCQGYALAFVYVMNKLGIECHMVTSDTMNHAWNVVKIDGSYYHIDATWDDPVYDTAGKVEHEYFLFSDKKAKQLGYTGYNTKAYPANNTKYDNYFWTKISSAFTYYNGAWYYIDANYDSSSSSKWSAVVYKYNVKTGGKTKVYDLLSSLGSQMKWNVVGKTSSLYKGCYSTFVVYNGKLYFNTKEKIYVLNVNNKTISVSVTPKTTSAYIYGLGLVNGKLAYQLKTSPSVKGALYNTSQTCVLSTSNYFSANVVCEPRNITSCKTTLSGTSFTYTGSAIKPSVKLVYGSYTLVNGTDYTVSYSKNVAAGTATVKVTGKGNYVGSVSKNYTIKKRAISNCSTSVASATYTGKALTPKVVVKYGSVTLTKGTHYTLTYSNNKNIGKGYVKITGKGNFTGSVQKTFTIKLATVSGLKAASKTKTSIKLSWKKVTGATYYQVYRYDSKTKTYKYIGKTSKTTYTNKGLTKNKSYVYKVRAGKGTSQGSYSSKLTVKTPKK